MKENTLVVLHHHNTRTSQLESSLCQQDASHKNMNSDSTSFLARNRPSRHRKIGQALVRRSALAVHCSYPLPHPAATATLRRAARAAGIHL